MIDKKYLDKLKTRFSSIPSEMFVEVSDDLFECATFYYHAKLLPLDKFPIHHDIYIAHLGVATKVYIEIGSLSVGFDMLLQRYEALGKTTQAYYLNEMGSYLVELLMDDQKPVDLNTNYRFGIGYQGTPLSDLKPIVELLDSKSVISFTESGFMKPIKTIVGFRGVFDDSVYVFDK